MIHEVFSGVVVVVVVGEGFRITCGPLLNLSDELESSRRVHLNTSHLIVGNGSSQRIQIDPEVWYVVDNTKL